MSRYLYNKRVIISGASSGIGKCLTKILIEKYNCYVTGIGRSEAKLTALKTELCAAGFENSFDYAAFDATDPNGWKNLAAELDEDGKRPDILINNAGMLPRFCRFELYQDDEIRDAMNINFGACVISTKIMLPLLGKSQSGGIVNMSSADALAAIAGTSVYSAGKAAVKAFTDALREEKRGVMYVGLICPGFNRTPLFDTQNLGGKSNIVMKFASSPERTARIIARSINRRKYRTVIGADARFMDAFARIMPRTSLRFFAWIIRKAAKNGLDIFGDVF